MKLRITNKMLVLGIITLLLGICPGLYAQGRSRGGGTTVPPVVVSPDRDGDWLLNEQETNTGVFVSLNDTGTDPNRADTDGDGTPDGVEINVGTNPTDPTDAPQRRPNIIFILVDDLGYGDIGVFYQNSRTGSRRFDTPELDRMANEGAMMTHHYVPAPVCAPSRGSLLQGLHQGHANVRDNQFDKALEDNHTLATVLSAAGYYTAHVGKYGVPGSESESYPAHPLKRGFHEFFGYLKHRDGHEHYPRNGTTDKKAYLVEGTQRITTGTDKVYTTDVFTARTKKIIVDRTQADPNQPFFLYLCYETPHFKLQVPSVAYPEGRGINGGIQWTGPSGSPRFCNTATGTINSYVYPEHRIGSWPKNEQIHASMIRRIGDGVGDILQLLRDLNIDDNTLVVFTSDNGPHHEGGQDPRFFGSYAFMDGTKRDVWEAGIRVPTIAWWPTSIPAGSENAHPSGFWDWLATFADLAQVPAPAYNDGVSLVPSLTQTGEQRIGTVYVEYQNNSSTKSYTEFEPLRRGRARRQTQALRLGRYMGVRTNITNATDDFEIYDVVDDPKQTTNLAKNPNFANLQRSFQERALQIRRPGGGVTRPYDNALVPPVAAAVEPGLTYRSFEGVFGWVPDFTTETAVTEGLCANLDLALRSRDDFVGLEFTGFIRIDTDGTYAFSLLSDSGAHLRLHDMHLIDDDYGRNGQEKSATVRLQAGLHPIRVSYRHNTGNHQLQLSYAGPGIPKQAIPDTVFFRAGAPTPEPTAFNDSAEAEPGKVTWIDVLANDIDDLGRENLTIKSITQPSLGSAQIVGAKILYAAPTDKTGVTSFEYTISDGTYEASATVTVEILAPLTSDLLLPLDETEGSLVHNSDGRVVGTLTGFSNPDSAWVPGWLGNALQCDGQNDHIVLDSAYVPPVGGSERSLVAWVKARTPGAIVAWGPKSTSQKWYWRVEDAGNFVGALRIEVEGGYLRGTTSLLDNQWHHVAVVLPPDGTPNVTDCRLYVDGQLEPVSESAARSIDTQATAVTIGKDGQDRHMQGIIDEVTILARALNTNEIAALAGL